MVEAVDVVGFLSSFDSLAQAAASTDNIINLMDVTAAAAADDDDNNRIV